MREGRASPRPSSASSSPPATAKSAPASPAKSSRAAGAGHAGGVGMAEAGMNGMDGHRLGDGDVQIPHANQYSRLALFVHPASPPRCLCLNSVIQEGYSAMNWATTGSHRRLLPLPRRSRTLHRSRLNLACWR